MARAVVAVLDTGRQTIPSGNPDALLVLAERVIDGALRPDTVNVLSFDEIRVPVQERPRGSPADEPAPEFLVRVSAASAKSEASSAADYLEDHHAARAHLVEVRRRRLYVQICTRGGNGWTVRVVATLRVERKRPRGGYGHVTRMRAEGAATSATRVLSNGLPRF